MYYTDKDDGVDSNEIFLKIDRIPIHLQTILVKKRIKICTKKLNYAIWD